MACVIRRLSAIDAIGLLACLAWSTSGAAANDDHAKRLARVASADLNRAAYWQISEQIYPGEIGWRRLSVGNHPRPATDRVCQVSVTSVTERLKPCDTSPHPEGCPFEPPTVNKYPVYWVPAVGQRPSKATCASKVSSAATFSLDGIPVGPRLDALIARIFEILDDQRALGDKASNRYEVLLGAATLDAIHVMTQEHERYSVLLHVCLSKNDCQGLGLSLPISLDRDAGYEVRWAD